MSNFPSLRGPLLCLFFGQKVTKELSEGVWSLVRVTQEVDIAEMHGRYPEHTQIEPRYCHVQSLVLQQASEVCSHALLRDNIITAVWTVERYIFK